MFRFTLPALLLLNLTPVASEQLRIRCDVNGGPTLITFDTTATSWKSEGVGGNTIQEGQIMSADDREIEFEILRPNRLQARFFYIRNEGRIYSQDNFERLVKAENCVPTPSRKGPT
jgi:hypothetical protein